MDASAMAAYGEAMRAYFEGETGAELLIRRDDGQETPIPVSHFFRTAETMMAVDKAALEHCRGRVLDVGAGSGLHSLILQERGLAVTPIDICPQAVEIMRQRGLQEARCADIFQFQGGPFDTILMIGHGIGIVETIAGLDRLLAHAHNLLSSDGRWLVDSMDVRMTGDAGNLTYLESNRRAGRYFGEIRLQLEFRDHQGPLCGWLHVDAETLRERAAAGNWHCEVIHQQTSGDYLAKLVKRTSPA